MNVDIHTISLFTGVGMLDVAARLAIESFGGRTRALCYVERDSAAASIIVAGMGGAYLDRAPIWDELESFDGRQFRETMAGLSILTASPPCPSFSTAGKRGGNDDARAFGIDGRGPQYHTLRIIGECRPAVVLLENVPGWVADGHFQRFGEGLCDMGYEIKDPLFLTAEAVGAYHERERVFVLAVAGGGRWRELFAGRGSFGGNAFGRAGAVLSDADQRRISAALGSEIRGRVNTELAFCDLDGWAAQRRSSGKRQCYAEPRQRELAIGAGGGFGELREPSGGHGQPQGCDGELADGGSSRRRTQGYESEPSGRIDRRMRVVGHGQRADTGDRDAGKQNEERRRWSGLADAEHQLGHSLSARGGLAGKGAWDEAGPRIGPGVDSIPIFCPARNDFRSWAVALGLDATLSPAVEPAFPMVVDGHAYAHADLLRCGGNSVVPLAGAIAFRVLLDRLANEE